MRAVYAECGRNTRSGNESPPQQARSGAIRSRPHMRPLGSRYGTAAIMIAARRQSMDLRAARCRIPHRMPPAARMKSRLSRRQPDGRKHAHQREDQQKSRSPTLHVSRSPISPLS
jgi:hypothetical protein